MSTSQNYSEKLPPLNSPPHPSFPYRGSFSIPSLLITSIQKVPDHTQTSDGHRQRVTQMCLLRLMLFFYKPTVTELGYAKIDAATVPSVDSTAKMHNNYLSAYKKGY